MFGAKVVLFVVLMQAVPDLPVRLGYTGAHVSNHDVADIAAALSIDSAHVWLVVALSPSTLNLPEWYVDVFLAPDRATRKVRRGRMERVKGTLIAPQVYEGRKPWDKMRSNEYAQVAMPGVEPFRVTSGKDLRRPFRVNGTFTGEELVFVVDFVRGSPTVTTKTAWPHNDLVRGDWPIGSIARKGDEIEVTLLEPKDREQSGQIATLRRDGKLWTVMRVSVWVVD